MSEKECGCCEGIEPVTPQPTANRPGLNALAYRVGTHATFLATMKARLSNICVGPEGEVCDGSAENGRYPLRALTTRAANDPAIALLDGWAMVADVLTFYQERIANEGYLRPATERRSILELARLVGYRLRPGVASSVYLAFTLDNDQRTEIPAGSRAQSLPGPDELPQPFETAEPLQARAAWNALKPRLTRAQPVDHRFWSSSSLPDLYVEGVNAGLKANDPLLFVLGLAANQQRIQRIQTVEPDAAANHTKITLQSAAPVVEVPFVRPDIRPFVDHYLDLEARGIAPDRAMTQRVTAVLSELSDELEACTTNRQVRQVLTRSLTLLRKEYAIAAEGQYSPSGTLGW
jgi:hypothetical protein